MARKRRSLDHDADTIAIPYIDADTGEGEMPLAELDEFVIPGSDDKGRKVTVTFNVHPALDRQIDVILASRRFPYANKKDLFRHAVARHCGFLLDIRTKVPRHFMAMFDLDLEIVKDDEASTKMEQVLLALSSSVDEHVQRGEHSEAIRLISQIQQNLSRLKPSTWQKKFSERFFSRYAGWLHVDVPALPPSDETETIEVSPEEGAE